jgi:HD-GYP domain-containing protein (c-di-GMP phosphodiesterase class II)
MLMVPIERLTPGMITAAPILHPSRPSTHLVQVGIRLTGQLISRARELRVRHAWIKHPLLDDLDGMLITRIPERRRQIYESVKQGFDELQHRAITIEDYRRYAGVIAELIEELLGREAPAGELAERLFGEANDLAGHCANVAYLSTTIALHLENQIIRERQRTAPAHAAQDLRGLGVGAMLHDIGKLKGPEEIRQQHETMAKRHPEYGQHVLNGYHMLRHKVSPVATAVALHHHQRFDGTGWPDMHGLTHGRRSGALAGRRIHVFGRIVAAANLFDNLTTRANGVCRPAIFALHAMQQEPYVSRLDPMVLEAVLRYLPPFPLGAEVVLNDGRLAAVTELNPSSPCRPKLRILENDNAPEDIDLARKPQLAIYYALGSAVSQWLYELPSRKMEEINSYLTA